MAERPRIISRAVIDGNKVGMNYTEVPLPTTEDPRNRLDIRTLHGSAYDGRLLIVTLAEKPRGSLTDEDHARMARRTADEAWARVQLSSRRKKPRSETTE